MGGGCVCDNYLEKYYLDSSDNIIQNDSSKNMIFQNSTNQITNKTTHILYNILENNHDIKNMNKRYSDFLSYEKRNIEKSSNLKNLGIKVSNNDCRNTSLNETSVFNQRINEDTNKKISSNYNSSNFNGSIKKGNEVSDDNINNINTYSNNNNTISNNYNNVNLINENNNKHNIVLNKIKKSEENNNKEETNINCKMKDNNYFLANESRSLIDNYNNDNSIEQFESTTPKMMIEKHNFEDISKGNKKLFSHYCKRANDRKTQCIINNQLLKNVILNTLDMNKYSEEMLNTLNSIRKDPKSFITHIDYLLNNSIKPTEEGIFLISHEVDERIKLMDNYKEMFNKTKDILTNINNAHRLERMTYNDDLEIIFDETLIREEDEDNINESNISEYEENDIKNLPSKLNNIYDDIKIIDDGNEENDINLVKYNDLNIINLDTIRNEEKENNQINQNINDTNKINIYQNTNTKPNLKKKKKKKHNINTNLDLSDDKIANLILQKRKEIKKQYPKSIFKMSVIKDIKISILIQISMEEYYKVDNRKTLKDILFDSNYKYFGLSWTNEINRNFISISCFA